MTLSVSEKWLRLHEEAKVLQDPPSALGHDFEQLELMGRQGADAAVDPGSGPGDRFDEGELRCGPWLVASRR